MKKAYEILIKPILTEKMLKLQDTEFKYGFKVDRKATKIDIRRAIQERFDNVTVTGVQTMTVHGKTKQMNTRRGLTHGRRATWKKAIVTLRKGDSINFFENQ
ncbi:50S ribosomal protein L23 [bacterium]|nr:50S ribosomal protein L23 [bacterium]